MMKFMLDTDSCIHLLNRSSPKLLARVLEHHATDFAISTVTAAELAYGVAKSTRRADNEKKLDLLYREFATIAFDAEAVEAYGPIRAELERKGSQIGPLDTLIAAHALSLGVVLITHNTREFRRVRGLAVESWLA